MREQADRQATESGRAPFTGAVQDNICRTREERDRVRTAAGEYVLEKSLSAPLGMDELLTHADRVLSRAGLEARYREFASVCVYSEVWRSALAGIPYDRRLLLLPKCLRDPDRCKAPVDEFGLICAGCGCCVIDELQTEAKGLGYVVMVAEGSPLVMALIESGRVEAVVGVSCLSVLEKVFPYMDAAAVPGIAIPLLREGCERTAVDLDYLWDAIYLSGTDHTPRLDLEALRQEVKECFTERSLQETMGPVRSETEGIARRWLAKSGKRWRPFLAACVYESLVGKAMPQRLRKLLVAVESFHKASLIHDDIEDGDLERYGSKTVHAEYGVPVAVNVGDFLVVEGYRLIGELEATPVQKVRMLQAAAAGHCTLSMGQGEELCWLLHRKPLSSDEVLSIFRQKTAPAFEVALHLGAICADAGSDLMEGLHQYSDALGVAYQIRDDIADSGLEDNTGLRDPSSLGPSLLPALAHERAQGDEKEMVESWWRGKNTGAGAEGDLLRVMKQYGVLDTARAMLDRYRKQAAQTIRSMDSPVLRTVLYRVVGKIFSDVSVMGCCNDHQAKNAPCGGTGDDIS